MKWTLFMRVPVTDENGNLIGYVPVAIEFEGITSWYTAMYVYCAYEFFKREFKKWQELGYKPETIT